jgi:hypothetical protein
MRFLSVAMFEFSAIFAVSAGKGYLPLGWDRVSGKALSSH